MNFHVLPGDSLLETFKRSGIGGEVVVCREAFVAGDLDGDTLEQLWDRRANFVGIEYSGDPIDYREKVAGELERLLDVGAGDEVNLWFEYELFCSVNMWFCLDLLKNSEAKTFRVAPLNTSPDEIWEGFGKHSESDLIECLDARDEFSEKDVEIGGRLWNAYRTHDAATINELGGYRSPRYPFLKEVCDAAAEVDRRPVEIVRELQAGGFRDIETLFPEFRKRAGVFGFGDAQVESLMRRA